MAYRSIPLTDLQALADTRCDWVSLQRDPDAVGTGNPAHTHFRAAQPGPGFGDFQETAGCVQALDLVLTVDTSLAHLAGALGRPAWVLLPRWADWRWLLDRADTPWYPTLTLFRQTIDRDWTEPLRQVRETLDRLIAEKTAP